MDSEEVASCKSSFHDKRKMDSEGESSVISAHISAKRKLPSANDFTRSDHKVPKLTIPSVEPNTTQKNDGTSTELLTTRSPEAPKDPVCNIDILSDDVLLILFSYLNSTDLYNLSLCNRRFNNVCRDKTLWYRVKAVCNGRSPIHINMRSYFHDSTSRVQLSKLVVDPSNDLIEPSEDMCFNHKFLRSLRHLPYLKTFILENHSLDATVLNLKYLPKSITELRLTKTTLLNLNSRQNGVFHNVHEILPNLEIVDVSFCQWLHPQILFSLSKCPKMKVLIMMGCRTMRDIIPYASIASMFGYYSLETLDMRLTYIGDSEIGCFNKIKNLKHILLEKPEDVASEGEDESITDICTTNLGMRNWRPAVAENNVYICPVPVEGGDFVEDTLETLVVRNYPRITNITLKHAEKCLKSLKYLDVTGTSCSAEQIAIFKSHRPEVKLLHDDFVT